MGYSEADTRPKLIDPGLHACGWTEELIRREETVGASEVITGKPRKRAKGRVDHTLRIKVNLDIQPVAIGLIEAKAEHLPPPTDLRRPNSTPRIIVSAPPQMMQWFKTMTTNAYSLGVQQHAWLGF